MSLVKIKYNCESNLGGGAVQKGRTGPHNGGKSEKD